MVRDHAKDLCACGHKRRSHRLDERECFYSSCLCMKFDYVNAEFPLAPRHFVKSSPSVMNCRVCRGNIDRCDCGEHETIAT